MGGRRGGQQGQEGQEQRKGGGQEGALKRRGGREERRAAGRAKGRTATGKGAGYARRTEVRPEEWGGGRQYGWQQDNNRRGRGPRNGGQQGKAGGSHRKGDGGRSEAWTVGEAGGEGRREQVGEPQEREVGMN